MRRPSDGSLSSGAGRRRRAVLLGACVALAGATTFAAGAPSAAGAKDVVVARGKAALAAWAKHDVVGTVRALEEALAAARAQAPLMVRQAVVVQAPHKGLGLYDPVEGPIAARALNVYVEVASFAVVVLTPATTTVPALVRATLEVRGAFSYDEVDEQGVVTRIDLGEKPLGTQTFDTRATDRVTSFGLDVALGERAPAGTYHVDLRVKDTVAGTVATRPLTFTLR